MSDDAPRPPLPPSRRSYFQEAPMEEYTPANSINEEAFRDSRRQRGCLQFWIEGNGKLVLRVGNAALHLGFCCVLLAIMVEFMVRYRGHKRGPQAIALVTLVAVDCCLDAYSVARLRKKWHGWAIVLRLLLALGYIAQFLVYVGFWRVFPSQYAYWGMEPGLSEPVVYLLLLILGLWDMLHTAIHRHTLGRDLRQCFISIQTGRQRRQASHGNGNDSFRAAAESGQPRVSSVTDVEHGSDFERTIALGDMNADDKSPGVIVTGRSGTSFTSGEASSQGESTVHTESQYITPQSSRRPSATISDDTGQLDGEVDNAVVKGTAG